MTPIDYAVPGGYAGKITPARYKLLVDEAVRVLRQRFQIAFVSQGMVYFAAAGKNASANLLPLVDVVAGAKDDGALLDAVHAHVSKMLYATKARERAVHKPYEQIRGKLAVRLYPPGGQVDEGGDFVTARHLPDVVSVLMLDDEGAFASVSPDMLAPWGIDEAEAFRVAIANASRRKVKVEKLRPKTPSGTIPITMILEDNHASSFALALPMFDRRYLGEFGAVVAVPGRESALCARIDRDSPADVVEAFVATVGGLVRANYEKSDRPVSRGFYWLDALGVFTKVEVRREGGRTWTAVPERLRGLRA